MNREYHRWYSPALGRDMELLVFGHAGAKVLVFPTRVARFHEYEDLRIVETLRPRIEAGEMQLFCVDSIDEEAFYNASAPPADRVLRHLAYEQYILTEVLPFMDSKNNDPMTVAHGCSMGAFHAANIAFRHPLLFDKLIAFSGRYDPTLSVEHFRDLLDGHRDENVFSNSPVNYLPTLAGWRLDALRAMEIVLVIGKEDPFLENNHHLSQLLWSKGVAHTLHEWDERAHRGYYWRRMAPQYVHPPQRHHSRFAENRAEAPMSSPGLVDAAFGEAPLSDSGRLDGAWHDDGRTDVEASEAAPRDIGAGDLAEAV
jgi:esterase/lipase superfamily enzyme